MPDQTRKEWYPLRPDELGTLVIVSANENVHQLLQLMLQYTGETFGFDDEAQTKFYFSGVPYGFAAQASERLTLYFYAWIPDGMRDFFKGKCSGEDCTHSRECKRPGCICTKSLFSSTWKCR